MLVEKKLTDLKKELVEYASLVEKMIEKSTKGLLNKEKNLLSDVIQKHEPKVNTLEMNLDEQCTILIAQYQPAAKDLRTILMILKMANDLERMGDHTVNIAESALFLIERPPVKPLIDIPRMTETTQKMLHDGIEAFINEDVGLAKNVCERDNIVDNLQVQILRELITFMGEKPAVIERSLHLIRIANNLERIADLSTNICEDVVFMAEGKVIKHHRDE